jgi:YD repeat-containing protein
MKSLVKVLACFLLIGSSAAYAVFPRPTFYLAGHNLGLPGVNEGGSPKKFSSALEACLAILTPPYQQVVYNNIGVVPELGPGGVHTCLGDHPQAPCNPSSVLCFHTVYHARPITECPSNSVNSGPSGCNCNASFQQANSTCSGGKNNDIPCHRCGNPVNPANGNKVEPQSIYRGLRGFELSLTYNTFDDVVTRFGSRWRDSYNRQVLVDGEDVQVYRPGGKVYRFVAGAGSWLPEADIVERLVELQNPPGTRIGWQLRVGSGDELETYDASGKLLAIRLRSGLTQTLTYSDGTGGPNGGFFLDGNGNPTGKLLPAGLLLRASDHFGRTLSFGYNQASRVVKLTDPAGGVYRFTYLLVDRLQSITYPDSSVRSYVYNEPAHTGGANLPGVLTGIVDENGARYATFKYDSQRRTISTEHAEGASRYTLIYGTGTATVTSPLGAIRAYSFQTTLGASKNTGISGGACPDCGPAAQAFDANGNVASRTDWNGNRTDYTYDLARNLETSRTEGLTSTGGITPQTRTITTEWHTTLRVPARIAEPLRITTLAYDAAGNVLSRTIQPTSDADGAQGFSAPPGGAPRGWTYTYNVNGDVLTVDGPRIDVSDVTTYAYYANDDPDPGKRGNLATITNAAGHVTSIAAYDAHGQPLTAVDANGLSTTLSYDARQRLKTRTVGGETTAYDYDGVGQLTKVTLPDGSFLSYSYDSAHRLIGMQDNLGNRIAYTLDAMGNRTLEQVRDPANELAQTRSRVYSDLSRLAEERGAQGQVTEYTYDSQGNILTVEDPLNRITSNQYDALNRLKQTTSPAPVSALTRYGYNGLDALAQVTDPRNLVTGYTVDGLGNLNFQSSPDTGATTSTYDPAGNLLAQTDAKQQVTRYAYDAMNRVTTITFHDGSRQTYAYDEGANAIGRLASITERDAASQVSSAVTYSYDQHGRVTAETRSVAASQYVLAYGYDTFGRLVSLIYPSGRTVTYAFDEIGRVRQITTTRENETEMVVQAVLYHPFGGVKGFTLGNGQAYTRAIDLDGRVASYTLGKQSFDIAYDAASRIALVIDAGKPVNMNTYGYDELDRVTSAALLNTSYVYNYDAVGNRRWRTAGTSTENYTYGTTSNRITSIIPASGPVRHFVFDANGSTTADGLNTYAYDTRGRMVAAVGALGTTNYQLNALGQRIRKTSGLTDTIFHYDARGRLIAETDPNGRVMRELIYLGDIPVGVVQ